MDKQLNEAKRHMEHHYFNNEINNRIQNGVKKKIREEKSLSRKVHFRYVVLSLITVSLGVIFILSQVSPEEVVEPIKPAMNIEEKSEEYQIDSLLKEHPTYKTIYEKVDAELSMSDAAKDFIIYLEALRRQDETTIRKYVTDRDQQLNYLFTKYKNIDFASLEVIDVMKSQAEPSHSVTLKYNEGKDQFVRTIYVNLYEETTIGEVDHYLRPLSLTEEQFYLYPQIDEKVRAAKRDFEVGMSKTEVVQIFGDNFIEYKETIESESDSENIISYDLFTSPTYKRSQPYTSGDYNSFKSEDIHLQINIMFDSSSKAVAMKIFYNDNGGLYTYTKNKDGENIDLFNQ